MIEAIMVTIIGDMFLFKDNNFTAEEYNALQKLANSYFKKEHLKENNEKSICLQFVEIVNTKLNIVLEPIEVSFIVRIK